MADLSEEIGSGSTPRKGAGSIATDAADNPRPAIIWASSPPKEWPITAGFLVSFPITSPTWSATWPTVFLAKTSGFALASSTVSGSSGHEGARLAYPASSKTEVHRSQLLGSSQRPWMKTTGVRPEAFAASISWVSRSVILGMRRDLPWVTDSYSNSDLRTGPREHSYHSRS